ncbi:MAG: GNAT family protein [Planctomycetota bacterium]
MENQGQTHRLNDGTEVLIRPLREDDFESSMQFFKELPEENRNTLRVDVTDPDVLKKRLRCEGILNTFRVGAFVQGRMVGDGLLEWPKFGWMSHVGEIRFIVAKDFRRRGLASLLFRQLFFHGVREGLEKVETRFIQDQTAARKVAEKMGFTEEGILPGFALDLRGKIHDLVIMSTHVEGF